MALQPGTKLGPYEILSPIETGNGSETYKASDAQSNRTVAIQVLPPEWSGGPAAQTVAALNHPHVCALHEIGREESVDFLVLEHLEGETLAARLSRGALDLGEALTVGIAIADVLNQAHRAGVTHGALTPANVMLTKTGAKLLGFGGPESRPADVAVPKSAGGAGPKPGVDPSLYYTAPEQFEGKNAGASTDIFSLGAILYEMVAGKKAFEGMSRAALIAAIATADPVPLTAVKPRTPKALEHVVERCLAKDPADRWQTAHDLLVQLRWISGGVGPGAVPAGGVPRLTWILLAAGVVAMAVLAFPAASYLRGPGEAEAFQLRVPVRGLSPADIALSPDGSTIALVARPDPAGPSSLYVRRVGALAFNRLGGTDDAALPFWSPDSRLIAFTATGRLKKVSAAGGAPQDIGEAPGFSGGTWNAEGTILFGSPKGLFRVSAEGGKPAPVTTLDAQETGHFWPNFLPGGRSFLYLAWSAQAGNRAVFAGKLDSKEKTKLLAAESNPAYAAPGYVLFHREASLFAQPFDAKKLAFQGEPVHVADEVQSNPANGRGNFDVSQNGALLYFQGAAGATAGRGQTVAGASFGWVDRTGKQLEGVGEAQSYGDMDLSPDGKTIAVTRQDTGSPGADIWTIDWQRAGVATRLTLDPADDINPVWSPDGIRIAFTSFRKGNADIYVKNANGSGAEAPLLETANDEIIEDWSKDGRFIAYLAGQDNFRDIWALPISIDKPPGDQKPFPVVQGRFQKNEPQFSYDGKWLAYTSNESGEFHVYVTSFPAPDQKIQVSKEPGGQPRWRRDGKELYYRATDGNIMAVEIKAGVKPESGVPRPLFRPLLQGASANDPTRHMISVTPDGQRFLVRSLAGGGGARGGFSFGGVAGAGSTAPQAPTWVFAQGARGPGRGGQNPNIVARGLTVIQTWTSALRKGDR